MSNSSSGGMKIKGGRDQRVLSVLWELTLCPRKLRGGVQARQKPGMRPGEQLEKPQGATAGQSLGCRQLLLSSRSEPIPTLLLPSYAQHLKQNPTEHREMRTEHILIALKCVDSLCLLFS